LSTGQLDRICSIKPRTLRKYHGLYFVDRIPILIEELIAAGLSDRPRQVRLYKLGPVGEEIARRLFDNAMPTGYDGYGSHRILHDVLTNESVLRVGEMAIRGGYEATWKSKFQATIFNERGAPALEPDAMLSMRRDDEALDFFFEFHNEDHSKRAARKVERYERVYRDYRWHKQLPVEDMPTVLVVLRHEVVGRGYQNAVEVARRMGLGCTFLGKSWDDLVHGGERDLALWWNFGTERIQSILQFTQSEQDADG
ncbi:MAG: replication-relaxation family protein, partial [Anaerolineales bacterium]